MLELKKMLRIVIKSKSEAYPLEGELSFRER